MLPKYDPHTETKLSGTVEEVARLPPKGSEKDIVHLMVKSGTEIVDVYLCPKSFLDDMGVTFSKGDEVEVTGSKVKQDGADLVLAREVVRETTRSCSATLKATLCGTGKTRNRTQAGRARPQLRLRQYSHPHTSRATATIYSKRGPVHRNILRTLRKRRTLVMESAGTVTDWLQLKVFRRGEIPDVRSPRG